ncbi:hypothetical protein V7147_20920, partial [Bacillus sp. JJ1521]|uniref:hypothetical protein n=1 Tax=Bacillus sp. JJ1521 TaxID=3122957 RepID=UPI003000EB5F
ISIKIGLMVVFKSVYLTGACSLAGYRTGVELYRTKIIIYRTNPYSAFCEWSFWLTPSQIVLTTRNMEFDQQL